jgi:hypothetical protein
MELNESHIIAARNCLAVFFDNSGDRFSYELRDQHIYIRDLAMRNSIDGQLIGMLIPVFKLWVGIDDKTKDLVAVLWGLH